MIGPNPTATRIRSVAWRRDSLAYASLVTLCLSVALGCVTRGTYREVVDERDRLTAQNGKLTQDLRRARASNESLSSERVTLFEQLEDLRGRREELERSIKKLSREREDLAASLASAEIEREKLADVESTYRSLVSDLESELTAGQIQIEQLTQGLRLNLAEEILFPSGSARLSQRGVSVIERVGDQLKDRNQGYRVDVQGHTDNVPIRGDLTRRYPTNWELAAARASSVVRVLEGRGVGAKRLSAVSLGEYHPVESNRSPQGRAKNRRIEIRLVPLESAGMEMPASGTGASASASTGGSPASEEDTP